MSAVKIPLTNQPGTFKVPLNGRTYSIRSFYIDAPGGGWCIDISDASGAPLICGMPLVTGADLLEQYPHKGIGGKMFVTTADPAALPTAADLGVTSFLWFEPNS